MSEAPATGSTRKKSAPPAAKAEDMGSARQRMEAALLYKRMAMAHCGACGAQGNWIIDNVAKPIRYLRCGHCHVGRNQIAITAEDIDAALAAGKP